MTVRKAAFALSSRLKNRHYFLALNAYPMECIISIELGTNAVRVYAFNLRGKTIGFAKGAYPTFHPDPDYSEQDPEQIFITMLYVLKTFLSEQINPQKYKVHSICFS